jgi:hypothetical protein
MKKVFFFSIFVGLVVYVIACKNNEIDPNKKTNKSYDPRNKVSVDVNGKVDTNFFISWGKSKYTLTGLYDTIPFPRYYSCPNEKERFTIFFTKVLGIDFEEYFTIDYFYPFVNTKQKYKKSQSFNTAVLSPKVACEYDSTFYIFSSTQFDYDIFGESYELNEVGKNDLIITSYDTLSGKMTGEFNLTFDKVYRNIRDKYYESLPQKLEYRNGKFTVFFKPIK